MRPSGIFSMPLKKKYPAMIKRIAMIKDMTR